MKHYILDFHVGSINHGCEALVRSTIELLGKENKFTLRSARPETDRYYRVDELCDIHNKYEKKNIKKKSFRWILAYLKYKVTGKKHYIDDIPYLNAIGAKKGDIAISIGGDNYCYDGNERIKASNELFRRNGIKTVLWGCSIEPELLTDPDLAEDISRFDLVTARETISYNAIKRVNKNTVLVSDSAFKLKTITPADAKSFEGTEYIGINLSPMAENCETVKGITKLNYEKMIEFILDNTEMNILLIPHVVKETQDDRVINKYFYDKYSYTGRVKMVEDCGCEELKGYISMCRFFIGARTHATIAAYSNLIPTLVLGYSVKSKGIARDLFHDEERYVIPVQNLKNEDDLKLALEWIMEHETTISEHLKNIMSEYANRVNLGVECIKKLK